jgi:hypothetical protein
MSNHSTGPFDVSLRLKGLQRKRKPVLISTDDNLHVVQAGSNEDNGGAFQLIPDRAAEATVKSTLLLVADCRGLMTLSQARSLFVLPDSFLLFDPPTNRMWR